MWSPDGHTVFYRSGRNVMAAKLSLGATVTVLGTTQLFSGDFLTDAGYSSWDPAPDGKRFLMLQNLDRQEETVIIHNWADDLRKAWR